MKLRKNIAVSDTGFVFDPASGNSFTTNLTGLEIIRLLREEKNEDEILREMHASYDAREETLKRDVTDFIGMLQRLRLTE